MSHRLSSLAALGCALLASGCQGGPTEAVEWSDAFEREGHGWSGGDAAYSVPLPGDRTLWLFGDSFVGDSDGATRGSVEPRFGNTMAIQEHTGAEPNPEDFRFDWGSAASSGWLPVFEETLDDDSLATPLAAARDEDRYVAAWPLHGLVIGPDLVLFNAAITTSGCDDCGMLGFETHGSTVSVVAGVDRPYDEWGHEPGVGWREGSEPVQRYVSHSVSKRPADDRADVLWGTWLLADPTDPESIFVYGHRDEEAELLLARVGGVTSAYEMMDLGRWQFWDGASWSPDASDARPVLHGVSAEASVMTTPTGDGFALVHSGPQLFAGEIHVATSDEPWGPFEETYVLALNDCPVDGFDAPTKEIAYGAKAHPALSDDESILVSVIVVPGETMAGAGYPEATHHYAPRFVRMPWDEVLFWDGSDPWRCGQLF